MRKHFIARISLERHKKWYIILNIRLTVEREVNYEKDVRAQNPLLMKINLRKMLMHRLRASWMMSEATVKKKTSNKKTVPQMFDDIIKGGEKVEAKFALNLSKNFFHESFDIWRGKFVNIHWKPRNYNHIFIIQIRQAWIDLAWNHQQTVINYFYSFLTALWSLKAWAW